MDTEEVVDLLIKKCKKQEMEIADLTFRLNTAVTALETLRGAETSRDSEHFTGQYTWDEAQRQFKVDL